jgi:hypothetical protein
MSSAHESLRPIDFLKSMGFGVDEKPQQLDRMLLKALSAEDRKATRAIWAARDFGWSGSLLEMYRVPKTRKQAALLFSHDWPRAAASMKWLEEIVRKIMPSSIVEMGCGAGFLLKYFKNRYPNTVFHGIDSAENLVAIGSELCGCALTNGDYLEVDPDQKYDLIVCDFGFDLVNFTSSPAPHTTENIGEFQFCPGCSDHLKPQFDTYLQAWRRWAHDTSYLSVAGRIGNLGMLKAFVLSAREVGWGLSLEDSSMLKTKHNGVPERFPALLFRPLPQSPEAVDFLAIAHFFAAS